MNRIKITLDQIRKIVDDFDKGHGICALVDVDNMGFCKDGKTRWYHFDLDGISYVYYKY
jgi:hypothetical protein